MIPTPQLNPIERQKRERRMGAWFMLGALVLFALVQWLARGTGSSTESDTPVAAVERAE